MIQKLNRLLSGVLVFLPCLPYTICAQDITLSPGTPAEVNMNGEILDAGVSLFRQAVEEDVIRNVVLLVARNGNIECRFPFWKYPLKCWFLEEQDLLAAGQDCFLSFTAQHLEMDLNPLFHPMKARWRI